MRRKNLTIAGLALLLVLATGAVVLAGLGTAGAQSTDAPADRTISVSATGQAEATPDQAVLRVAVTAEGEDPAAVSDELSAGGADLRSALDELGVEYETTGYRIDEQRDRRERSDEERPPYRGVHAFEVTVDDPDDVGAVIDAAANASAVVGNVEFTLSDDARTDLRNTAIENAMNDARSQADAVAAAGNLEVTGVAAVDASQRRYSPVDYDMGEGGDGASGVPTTIESGDVSVSYSVSVTYNATSA